jgi:hypothetical protein
MEKKRFTQEPIAFALHQAESGTPVVEIVRRLGVSEQTFYPCKKRSKSSMLGDTTITTIGRIQPLGNKSPIAFSSLQACGLAHMPVDWKN